MRAAFLVISACLAVYALAMLVMIAAYWPPRLGLDLGGGVSMVYEVDRELMERTNSRKVDPDEVDWEVLSRALEWRIDPRHLSSVIRRKEPWAYELY